MEKVLDVIQKATSKINVYESDNFIDDGLDSLDIIRLVAMLEETFDVNIDGMDIVPENFENAEAIANLLRRKGHEI